jgi:hypothetical protein
MKIKWQILLWVVVWLLAVLVFCYFPAEAHYDPNDLWHWLPETLNGSWEGTWE